MRFTPDPNVGHGSTVAPVEPGAAAVIPDGHVQHGGQFLELRLLPGEGRCLAGLFPAGIRPVLEVGRQETALDVARDGFRTP